MTRTACPAVSRSPPRITTRSPGERERGGGARLDVRGVDEPHGRGADLHVLAALYEALGHDPGEWSADYRLTRLVLRLLELRLRAGDVLGRHLALRARVLELAGAQRLSCGQAIEALERWPTSRARDALTTSPARRPARGRLQCGDARAAAASAPVSAPD